MTDTRGRLPSISDPTRGRVLALLREGPSTVEDLASHLGLTDNAVRFHLASLESQGAVIKEGVRRRQGAGKPADLFTITPATEESFSRAYVPVLTACLAELHDTMSTIQLLSFLKRVGKRLAENLGAASGSLQHRVASASRLLNDLGGVTV